MVIKLPKIAKCRSFSGFVLVNKDLTEFNSSRFKKKQNGGLNSGFFLYSFVLLLPGSELA